MFISIWLLILMIGLIIILAVIIYGGLGLVVIDIWDSNKHVNFLLLSECYGLKYDPKKQLQLSSLAKFFNNRLIYFLETLNMEYEAPSTLWFLLAFWPVILILRCWGIFKNQQSLAAWLTWLTDKRKGR